MRKKVQAEYEKKMANTNLSPEEQAVMIAELNAKMSNINDAIVVEEAAQNSSLEELLNKRRQKKDKLREKMEVLANKKQLEDEHYNKKLTDIAHAADSDKNHIESELKQERKDLELEIEEDLKMKKINLLSE